MTENELLASAMRKLLHDSGAYVAVTIYPHRHVATVLIDGEAEITAAEADACERVREEWRRAQR